MALVVARPVVLGEDPGMLSGLSDPGQMVPTLLWLGVAVGWAAWQLWAGASYRPRGGGVVGLALLVLVGLVFASAEFSARYQHPARLTAWEWLALLLAFFLVRRLAVQPDEQHGLFAALLASAVSLSGFAVYQAAVELPRLRAQYADVETLREAMARQNVEMNEGQLAAMRQRIEEGHVFATFAHPNSFAGFLALFLPGLAGALACCLRARSPVPLSAGVAVAVLLGAAGLWLSHSRGAVLALFLVALAAVALLGRRTLRTHPLPSLIGLAVVIGCAFLIWRGGLLSRAFGKTEGPSTVSLRLEYWRTTVAIIERHPWLGVGPANFGFVYPRFMAEGAGEKIKDPHNFALETWASSGLFALLALLAALAAFFARVAVWLARRPPPETEEPPPAPGPAALRWEFYLGGMAGLLLGFVLRAQGQPAEEIFSEALGAGLRSLLWFASFALFERVPWTDRGRVAALTAGVAALLLNLGVSGGIGFPAVAGLLWMAVALALNALPPAPSWARLPALPRGVPLAGLAALFAVYFLFVYAPVTTAAGLARKAQTNGMYFLQDMARPPGDREIPRLQNPYNWLNRHVLALLRQAHDTDPGNARLAILLAHWSGQLWALRPADEALAKAALGWALRAEQLVPGERDGYEAEYRLRGLFAARSVKAAEAAERVREKEQKPPLTAEQKEQLRAQARQLRQQARQQYRFAADALGRFVAYDPTSANLHFELAEALLQAGDRPAARRQAQVALHLDGATTWPTRRLTDRQRQAASEWAGTEAAR